MGHKGLASGRHQDMAGTMGHAIHRYLMGAGNGCPAFIDAHPGILQKIPVNTVQAFDFLVFVPSQRLPVKLDVAHRVPAIAPTILKGFTELGGVHKKLFGHTTNIHAGAAKVACFCYSHTSAGGRGHSGSSHATRASTDHEQVVVEL